MSKPCINIFQKLRGFIPASFSMKPVRYGVIWYLLAGVIFGFSQDDALKFERFTLEDGLPTAPATAPVQDANGFLWIGTWNGLYKYDGYTFQGFWHDPADPQSISHDWCVPFIDRQGNFWVGTRLGLDRFDPVQETFTHFLHDADDPYSISGGSVDNIRDDRHGRLWVGTGNGLNKFDPKTERFTRFYYDPQDTASLSGNQVACILEDDSGGIWIGTGNPFAPDALGGLNHFQEASGTFQRYFVYPKNRLSPRNFVQALWHSPEDDIWIGTWQGGLYRLNRRSGVITDVPDPRYPLEKSRSDFHGITDIAAQPGTDYFWLSTFGGGLIRYNRKSFEYDNFRFDPDDPFSISENRVWQVSVDQSNTLWIGTHTGLNKVDLSGKFPEFSLNLGADEWVTDILEDQAGILWLGTTEMRLIRWDRSLNTVNSFKPDSTNCAHWNVPGAAVAESANGWLWFANHCGLVQFNPRINAFVTPAAPANLPTDVTSDQPLKIIEDNFRQLWFSSHPLIRVDLETGHPTRYDPVPGNAASLSNADVDAIYEDRNGDIWAGTANGLNRYDRKNGSFTRFLMIEDAEKTAVTGIREGADGMLYVSTDTYGMIRLNPASGEYEKFTVRDGMHTNTFFNLLPDKSGAYWLFAASGATRYDPVSRISKYFDQSDGLVEMLFSKRAVYRTAAGAFVLGGRGSINLFDPADYRDSAGPPKVVLNGLRISGEPLRPGKDSPLTKPVSETKTLILAHDQNNLTFEFMAIDYRNPKLNQYRYRLENYDNGWVEAGAQRTARYTNLFPGTYTFQVIAANSDGVWNTDGVSLEIVIRKPWWQTWWAYLLYASGLLALLLGLRRYEMNRIHLQNQLRLEQVEAEKFRELDQLKSRFFANISHEFRTPLTLIIGQMRAIAGEIPKDHLNAKLKIALRNSHRLLHLVNQLLDISKLESGGMKINAVHRDVLPFLKNLVYSFESLAEERDIELGFQTAHREIVCDYEPDKLEKIILNLLSNAFKFTPAGGSIQVVVAVGSIPPGSGEAGKRGSGDAWSVERKARGHPTSTPKTFGEHPASSINDFIEIRVSDTGIGISAERLPHIFERFYQADDADTREYAGSGIGLSLVKELVGLFNGQISVSSEKGRGTTFTVLLPLRQQNLEAAETEASDPGAADTIPDVYFPAFETEPEPAPPAEIPPGATSVLLIEDNAEVRAYIREHLQQLYHVQEAADGRQGLRMAQASIPDLIISDVMMPGMDGFQLSRQIRADERTSHIPLILLTARAEDHDKIAGLQTGVDDYLIKPFNPEELRARIENLIQMRRKLRERFSTATIVRPGDVSVISADQQFLQRVLHVIEAEMGDDAFNVESLAAAVNLSETQLNRKLNALINQPPGQLLRSMRLERAADLLKQNAGNVAEICYQVGFSDQANFSRNFKKQFGVSPGKFKKQPSDKAG